MTTAEAKHLSEAKHPGAKATTNGKSREQSKDDSAAKQQLIDNLNSDLAGELQAVIMYTGYSACLTGPYRKELRSLFQGEITDELGHAQFLADKIAALGGKPVLEPRPVPSAETPHEMLVQVLAAERQAIADYKTRIEQADEFGDVGLRVQLENQISDETRHKEEVERILAGWDRDAN